MRGTIDMEISGKTKLNDLLDKYPFLVDFLAGISPEFKKLRNALFRKTMGKIATLDRVAIMGNMKLDELMSAIAGEVKAKAGEDLTCTLDGPDEGDEQPLDPEARQEVLKYIIRGVHDGEDMEILKKKFRELIKDVDPSEISKMEQTLIDEGMPETEVKRLCDVHVQVFKESLEKQEIPEAPPGHPVHTFIQENRAAEKIMDEIEELVKRLGEQPDEKVFKDVLGGFGRLLEDLAKIDFHYQRKENQLFPFFGGSMMTSELCLRRQARNYPRGSPRLLSKY
jgi:hypothetical protein